MSFRLDIDDGNFARTLEVRDPLLTVGTAAGCGLRLASEGVARRHASLRMCGRSVVIEDLGAPDGIRVRGRRVRRAALRVGDEIRLGRARLRVLDVLPVPRNSNRAADDPVARRRKRATAAFVASVVGHAVLLAALWTWSRGDPDPPEAPVHFAVASLEAPPEIAATPETETLPDLADLLPRDAEPTELLPLEEEPLPDLPPPEENPWYQPPPEAKPPITPIASEPEAPAGVVGLGGGEPAPEVASRGFGKRDAAVGNRMAAGLLEDDAASGAVLRGVRGRAATSNVWVVRGDYDQAEKTLHALGIDHLVLAKDELETRALPSSVRVLIYNCSGRPLSPEAQARVAAWVEGGGWLLSTDWGVERLLERGMPGTLTPLRTGERPVLTKDETVSVRGTTGRGLGAGLTTEGAARWWLEDSSVPFTVADGIGAEVLVRSDDLERRHGPGAAGVAVTFPHGRGRVLHLLGHLYQQEGNVLGALLVQRLLVNTLAAALK